MQLSSSRLILLPAAILFVSALTSACFVSIEDRESPPRKGTPTAGGATDGGNSNGTPPNRPYALTDVARPCDDKTLSLDNASPREKEQCYQDGDTQWRVSCKQAECQGVPVYVHYMLTENLGLANTVMVEAFDNPRFLGNPVSSVRVGNFNANRPGDYRQADLFLAPGEYYVRAYVSQDNETAIPYQYGGMQLISDKPIGVYGALSGVETLVVKPRASQRWPAPLNVYLDQLFKKPGNEAPTHANLRVRFSVPQNITVEAGRKVILQLHDDTDLAKTPVAQFELASENLLVEGHRGRAEYVANNLKSGNYFVYAFLDRNGNGYQDEGEPQQLLKKNNEPALVKIIANRTETVDLSLAIDGQTSTPPSASTPAPVPTAVVAAPASQPAN